MASSSASTASEAGCAGLAARLAVGDVGSHGRCRIDQPLSEEQQIPDGQTNEVERDSVDPQGGFETFEQVLESGGFLSRQRVLVREPAVEVTETGARWLGMTYWQAVTGVTRGTVRAAWSDSGGRLRLVGGATLFKFGPAELRYADGVVSCGYAIEGGVLALHAGGTVSLAQRRCGADFELSVAVDGYVPRLAARAGAPQFMGALYAKGQRPFHIAVSRRYFELLTRSRAA